MEFQLVFIGSRGGGFELFLPGGGKFTHQKNCLWVLLGGMVRLGID